MMFQGSIWALEALNSLILIRTMLECAVNDCLYDLNHKRFCSHSWGYSDGAGMEKEGRKRGIKGVGLFNSSINFLKHQLLPALELFGPQKSFCWR